MKKEYHVIVKGFGKTRKEPTIVFARPWTVIGDSAEDFDAAALDALGNQMKNWSRALRLQRKAQAA